jgi:predicted O-methyltransferase YrrM
MRPLVLAAALVGLLQATSLHAQTPSTPPLAGVSPTVQKLLAEIRAADKGMLAVSEEDGRFLRLMVAASGAKNALEIGGASGYSAIWIGLGLRETGGRLVTLEYDPKRAQELAANIKRAGFDDIVRTVAGDALKEVPKVQGPIDFVFIDAWKPDYKKYLDMVYPKLAPGGLIIAHNVVNKRAEMLPFLQAIEGKADLLTTIVSPSGEGVSVSWKRRSAEGRR